MLAVLLLLVGTVAGCLLIFLVVGFVFPMVVSAGVGVVAGTDAGVIVDGVGGGVGVVVVDAAAAADIDAGAVVDVVSIDASAMPVV